ncbi:Hypothetical protein A7982_07890 [Minicystis rosea]|nr:Hypothetical protein A7982_07890 [Minicystis rosea]
MESLSPALFDSPAAFRGADLASRADAFTHVLSSDELGAIERLVERLERIGKPASALTRDDALLEEDLARAVATWRKALAHGLGFVLVRGLPVHQMSEEEATLAYWALGVHLGTPAPQNIQGELLTHVRDTGADPGLPSTRLYTTRAEQDFHTDGADIIGLLCLRTARSGGLSRIVSSIAVIDAVHTRRPDLARVLFEDFPWHYHETGMPAPIWFTRPVCSIRGGRLNTFFIAWYIRRSQEIDGAPRLRPDQEEAIRLVEAIANDPALYLDMEFRPGDIQILKNSVVLHKRTAYEDWDAPAEKRHLLRLWLAAPDFDDGDEQLRRGIVEG